MQPHRVGDTGPSDLAKAARDDGEPGAAQALRSEGFVRGYQRLWVGAGDAEIILIVYQFGTEQGARSDFDRGQPRLTRHIPPGGNRFTVNGIPASQSTAFAGTGPDLSAATVLFTKGVFVVQVVCNGPSVTRLQDRVSTIASDQYSRL